MQKTFSMVAAPVPPPGRHRQMLKDADRRKFDTLIVWSIDRLGRSILHVANAMAELDAAGLAFYSDQWAIDGTGAPPAHSPALPTDRPSTDLLSEHDEAQVVSLGHAKSRIIVRKRLGLAGWMVAAARIPRDQTRTDIDHRHPDFLTAVLPHEVLRGGEQSPSEARVL